VIRYDRPGVGLSDRDRADPSLDGQVATALAVADAAGAERFRFFGASQGGQLAAAIAARYPGRVAAMAVYGMCARGSDLAPAAVRESVVGLVRAHWGLGLKAMTGAFVAEPTAEDLAALTRFQRASASSAVAADLLQGYYQTDVAGLLPAVQAPAAVLHRQADTGTPFPLGREVAVLLVPDERSEEIRRRWLNLVALTAAEGERERTFEGFTVLAYTSDDPRAAVRIKEAGAACVRAIAQSGLHPANCRLLDAGEAARGVEELREVGRLMGTGGLGPAMVPTRARRSTRPSSERQRLSAT